MTSYRPSEIEVARLRNIERAARRLRRHIRYIAYRDAAGLRLADAVPVVTDLDEALTLPELLTEPVREDELRHFLTDIRRRLDYLESRAARHPEPRDG